jgi:hypothetical protein
MIEVCFLKSSLVDAYGCPDRESPLRTRVNLWSGGRGWMGNTRCTSSRFEILNEPSSSLGEVKSSMSAMSSVLNGPCTFVGEIDSPVSVKRIACRAMSFNFAFLKCFHSGPIPSMAPYCNCLHSWASSTEYIY